MVTQKQILSKLNRKERGHLLVQNNEIERTKDGFKVPSQTTKNKEYTVKTGKKWSCTCHDHQKENEKCKHIWAVELILTQQAQKQDEQELRKQAEESYNQNWTAYNQSQTKERKHFLQLLSDLTQTVENQEQSNGRPRKDLGSMIFHSALKVYTGGIVGWISLQYLTPELAVFSFVMSVETGLIASFIAYSSTLSLGTELETSSGIAGSILPPLLCCSPLLPALGAVVASLTPLAINIGYLQGLIAVYETEILLGATLILGYSVLENSKTVRKCIN